MLKRTQDRKTANSVRPNGKTSRIANAFSLPAGRDYACPGATEYCAQICYAGKLEQIYPSFRGVVLHNWDLLKDASSNDMVSMLSIMIDAFVKECDKWNAPKSFRIHADGDFFNMAYVQAWARVIESNPDVQFWAYTRTDFAARYLHDLNMPNLGLYFSGDPDNIKAAIALKRTGINVAFVAPTFKESKETMAANGIKAVRCPEQNGAIPLIDAKGGACITCGLCVTSRNNVLFSASGK